MSWAIEYTSDAFGDLLSLDGSQRKVVRKAVARVAVNPLPRSEGGYGKPLGNRGGRDLTGLLKIKLRGSGLRIVYYLKREAKKMVIVVVGVRASDEVYTIAVRRVGGFVDL